MQSIISPKFIKKTRDEVARIIHQSQVEPRTLIERYTAAFAGNYQLWLAYTALSARHIDAYTQLRLKSWNEAREDHVWKLRAFAGHANANPDKSSWLAIAPSVHGIDTIFAGPFTGCGGLKGLVVCGVFELVADICTSHLVHCSKKCGGKVKDPYITDHTQGLSIGVGLLSTVDKEMGMNYPDPRHQVQDGVNLSMHLIMSIWMGQLSAD